MVRSTHNLGRLVRPVGLLFLAGMFLVASLASAQAIKVTSAVPDTTEQGVTGLVVTIGGENFGSGAKVNFYVTGTTNPGGIVVRSVRYRDSKTLEATVDVAPDAQTTLKFDIQVKCNGRTGKGTELFKVLEKVTGNDTIPPGAVTDLRTTEIGFNTAGLTWTVPAIDGYDPASGPAAGYELRVRKATPECGPYTIDIWLDTDDYWAGPHADPCHVYRTSADASSPGATWSKTANNLWPETTYWAAIRYRDDATPNPNWAELSPPISFTTGPSPQTPWTAEIPDGCDVLSTTCSLGGPSLDLDPSGNPALLYRTDTKKIASWTGSAWHIEPLPSTILLKSFDLAFDPRTGEATIAGLFPALPSDVLVFHRRTATGWTTETIGNAPYSDYVLGFDPFYNIPTIAYRYVKSNRHTLRVATRSAAGWTTEDVASQIGAVIRLAFDNTGHPAVLYVPEGPGAPELRFALRVGQSWKIEQVHPALPTPWDRLDYDSVALAFDPLRHDFAAVSLYVEQGTTRHMIRYCTRTLGTWTCETAVLRDYGVGHVALGFGPDGTGYLAFNVLNTLYVAVRAPSDTDWSRLEIADWNFSIFSGSPEMRIGPDGQPTMAYTGANGPSHAGGSDGNGSVVVVRRAPTQ